jgi:hypothetical protein
MSKQKKDRSDWDLTQDADKDRIGGGPGASDANSGAGNATGAPDAETGMRAGEIINRGDIEEDRAALFPDEAKANPNADVDRPPDEEDDEQ